MKIKKVFPKETGRGIKRKGKKAKKFFSQENRREGEKRKGFFFEGVETFHKADIRGYGSLE
jgi:hypothetical protein